MSTGQAGDQTAGAWSQVLDEAREIRSKQDNRLANAQRQSQLIVAGFLAMTAILVTAVSVSVAARPEAADTSVSEGELAPYVAGAFAGFALVNGVTWMRTHTLARHWREVAEFDALTSFPGSVDAVPRLQRHLVNTYLDHFNHNEEILTKVQRRVGAQAVLTLLFVYTVPLGWVLL
ncbi:hypothetical protein [Candidatus Poriferisodalis sp.]|uniref:hypothetical protein n=2 Tax=Candidatus Poriferisodalis sp. TaxID=3101277 RepID=UPI003AF7F47B